MLPSSALAAAAVPFLEDVYSRYQADPESVDPSWAHVFRLVDELAGTAAPGSADARWIVDILRRTGHRMAAYNPLAAPPEARARTLREKAMLAAMGVPPSAHAARAAATR
ncbi:hypothetical protein BZM26_00640 [Paraburkholderia strydomiana]|nr:hypothetical protein BZM26_00640 [Paraburkholderia strydomiana]